MIKTLSHSDPSKRRSASQALACGDERVIYPLIKALKDENPGVQDAAMRSLISIGGEVTAYMVIPLLRGEPLLRNTARIILKEIGVETVPLLHPLLKDKDDDIRQFAIDLISEIKSCSYPQEIVRVLETDSNPNVRASAARALGVLGYREALPSLINALRDDEWVCFSALESLAMIKDESSLGAIIPLLDSPSDAIRYAAIETLGRIGGANSINVLLGRLPKADTFEKRALVKVLVKTGITPSTFGVTDILIDMLKSDDWDERSTAIKGLADLRDERAIRTIIDIAGSLDSSEPEDEERLYHIKCALRRFGCTDVFVDVLNDPSVRYRGKVVVIEVIGELRFQKAVPSLIRLLKEDLKSVRKATVDALAVMEDDEVIWDALIEALYDHDGHVRRSAVAALGKVDNKKAFYPILDLLHKERDPDVIEEAVKSLLILDPEGFMSRLDGFDSGINALVQRHTRSSR